MENLKGKRFGMLEVLEYVRKTSYRDHVWKCRCDCGKVIERNQGTLKNENRVHSCGCFVERNLRPGSSAQCAKAGKQRAIARNVDGINVDMLDNSKNITTNTSGHKGISWSKSANKWARLCGLQKLPLQPRLCGGF